MAVVRCLRSRARQPACRGRGCRSRRSASAAEVPPGRLHGARTVSDGPGWLGLALAAARDVVARSTRRRGSVSRRHESARSSVTRLSPAATTRLGRCRGGVPGRDQACGPRRGARRDRCRDVRHRMCRDWPRVVASWEAPEWSSRSSFWPHPSRLVEASFWRALSAR